MGLGKLSEAVEKTVKSATGVTEATLDEVNRLMEEFYNFLPTIKRLGLTVELVKMKFGLPPGIRANLTGKLEDIDEAKVKQLIDAGGHNKILTLFLKAIRSVALLKKPLSDNGFKGLKIDLSLGAIPNMDIEVLQ
jgi:hypothetical protein